MNNVTRFALLLHRIAQLKSEQAIGAITPPRLADILEKMALFANDGEIPTTDIPSDAGMTDEEQQELQDMFSKVEVDRDNMLLIIKDNDDRFACPIEQLIAPLAPVYSDFVEKASINSSETISLTNRTEGAKVYYTLLSADGDTTNQDTEAPDPRTAENAIEGTSVTLIGILTAQHRTYKISVAAKKNGVWSDTYNKYTILTHRKIKTPTITADGNNWSDGRVVTIDCATSAASIKYSLDGSTPSEDYNAQTGVPISVTKTVKAQGVADGWVSSDEATASFTVKAKKAYYGFSTAATLANEAAIKALASTGGSQDATKVSGQHNITPTGNTAGYIWICCTGTINKDAIKAKSSDVIPFGFNAAVQVDGWNCYRSIELQNPEPTSIYVP